jgi:hypothetical protein
MAGLKELWILGCSLVKVYEYLECCIFIFPTCFRDANGWLSLCMHLVWREIWLIRDVEERRRVVLDSIML